MSFIQAAFEQICTEAKVPSTHYVCLIERVQAYGGPEEGGWWYTVSVLQAYQEFPSEELANAAAKRIEEFAAELQQQAQTAHGELCLNQMEWLEARGLEANFLAENDGAAEYSVEVCEKIPVFDNRRPHYE